MGWSHWEGQDIIAYLATTCLSCLLNHPCSTHEARFVPKQHWDQNRREFWKSIEHWVAYQTCRTCLTRMVVVSQFGGHFFVLEFLLLLPLQTCQLLPTLEHVTVKLLGSETSCCLTSCRTDNTPGRSNENRYFEVEHRYHSSNWMGQSLEIGRWRLELGRC